MDGLKMEPYSLGLRTAADCLGGRGWVLASGGAAVRGRTCGVWLRDLLSQRFKLVDEVGIYGRIEILNQRGQAIDLLDLHLAKPSAGSDAFRA